MGGGKATRAWIVFLFFFMAVFVGGTESGSAQEPGKIESSCVRCHSGLGGKYAEPVRLLRESVHIEREVACHDCHGGDPTSFDEDIAHSPEKGFLGRPSFEEIPEFCARCHSDPKKMKPYNLRTDQLALYKKSHHGELLYEKKDPNTATCVSCHGAHDIKSRNNPMSPVFKANIPKTCSRCHSDPARMEKYKLPVDQYSRYVRSVHGKRVLEQHDLRAPVCSDCHGVHSASPPGYEDVTAVCEMCHATIAKFFKQSPHFYEETNEEAARCVDCHGDHNVTHPTTALYEGEDEGHCGMCHESDSKQIRLARLLKGRIEEGTQEVENARRMLDRVSGSGKDLAELEEALETARSQLVQARAAAHTLSMEKVNEHITRVVEEAEKVGQAGNRILEELTGRRKGAVFALVILGIIIALVYAKIRTLKPPEDEEYKKPGPIG